MFFIFLKDKTKKIKKKNINFYFQETIERDQVTRINLVCLL